jgi:hypothetical protein
MLAEAVGSHELPATAGGQLDELTHAVHDQRYGSRPGTAYQRDPQVENVDVNGCDHQVRVDNRRSQARAEKKILRTTVSMAASACAPISALIERKVRGPIWIVPMIRVSGPQRLDFDSDSHAG